MEKEDLLHLPICNVCPLYGKTCDGTGECELVNKETTETDFSILGEYAFERDCYSF